MKLLVLTGLLGLMLWLTIGLGVAVATVVLLFLLHFLLATCIEVWCMHRYRGEYVACAEAVMTKNEQLVDQVNAWTTHYYVHKAFYMASSRDKLKVGYRYSVRTRPSRGGGGAGGGADPNVPFYFGV